MNGPQHWDLWEDYCLKCGEYIYPYEKSEKHLVRVFLTVCLCDRHPEPHFVNSVIHKNCLEELSEEISGVMTIAKLFEKLGKPLPPVQTTDHQKRIIIEKWD